MSCGDSFGAARFHALTGGRGPSPTRHLEAARRAPGPRGVSGDSTNSPDEHAISRPRVELVPAVGSVTGLPRPHRASDGHFERGAAPNPDAPCLPRQARAPLWPRRWAPGDGIARSSRTNGISQVRSNATSFWAREGRMAALCRKRRRSDNELPGLRMAGPTVAVDYPPSKSVDGAAGGSTVGKCSSTHARSLAPVATSSLRTLSFASHRSMSRPWMATSASRRRSARRSLRAECGVSTTRGGAG